MEGSLKKKVRNRLKRKLRVRRKLRGTEKCPRLCVVKTNQHIHAQIINDESSRTLVGLSTCAKEFRNDRKNCDTAKKLGLQLAVLAKEKNVSKVVFDRGMSKYHGIIQVFADAARSEGLQF